MKRGFEFFRTKKLAERIDFDNLELNYKVKLPPLYKLFAQSFELGQEAFQLEKFYNPAKDLYSRIESLSYAPGDISGKDVLSIDFFMDINGVFMMWENGLKNEIEWKELGLIKIGVFAYPNDAGIYLGTSDNNKDEIWRVAWDWSGVGDRCAKISNNIFEFVKGFESRLIQFNLKNVDVNNLYRKWNEDYWQLNQTE
jgi:hypothetical protein